MQVILLESLNKLGKAGEVVSVKDGYARNLLIPQKKAIVANKQNIAELESKMSQINENNKNKITEAKNVKNIVEDQTIVIEIEANEEGSLYGAINPKLVIQKINNTFSLNLSTDSLVLSNIKTIGTHAVNLRIYEDVSASINLELTNKLVSK